MRRDDFIEKIMGAGHLKVILDVKKLSVILHACTALVAELVDATDSKSVAFTGVPVRVWPRAPF